MTRIRVFVVFALAVPAGGAFAFATYNYVQKIPARTVAIPTRPVVIAATNLDVGDEIDSNDVRTIEGGGGGAPARGAPAAPRTRGWGGASPCRSSRTSRSSRRSWPRRRRARGCRRPFRRPCARGRPGATRASAGAGRAAPFRAAPEDADGHVVGRGDGKVRPAPRSPRDRAPPDTPAIVPAVLL